MGDFFASTITWLGAFFVFGTIWFWIVCGAFFTWMIILTEGESHYFAGFMLLGFVWIMSSVNGISIISHPWTILMWVGIYLVSGVVWSFFKWFSFLFGKRDEVKLLKDDFVKRFAQPLTVEGKIASQDVDDFIKFLNDQNYTTTNGPNYRAEEIHTLDDVIPTVNGRITDLTRWIVWWPMSMFWTVLDDPLRRFAHAIVRMFSNAYASIANSVFSKEI